MASIMTGGRSTAPAGGVPGPFSPVNVVITNWPQETIRSFT